VTKVQQGQEDILKYETEGGDVIVVAFQNDKTQGLTEVVVEA